MFALRFVAYFSILEYNNIYFNGVNFSNTMYFYREIFPSTTITLKSQKMEYTSYSIKIIKISQNIKS